MLTPALSAACYRALWLTCNDEFEAARAAFESLLAAAIETGDDGSQAQLTSFLGLLETRAGNWSRADDHLQVAIRLADLMGFAQGSGEKRALLALLEAQRGELETARAVVAEAMTIAEPSGTGSRSPFA